MRPKNRLLSWLTRSFFRPLSFFSKEFIQIWRQPRLILALIAGPFLVLLLFGVGYNAEVKPLRTILVLPADSDLPADAESYRDQFSPPFELAAVTRDRQAAINELRQRRVDVVLLFPERAYETIRSGQQAPLELLYNELDPLQRTWLEYYGYVQTSEFNRRLLVQVLQQSQLRANTASDAATGSAALVAAASDIPPTVLVSPFRPTAQNIAPTSPGFVAFYAPGVLALLVQHIAVTLTALSLVRERLSGAVELFRIAPVSSREIMVGKYVSYFLQTAVLTAILLAIMVIGLDVPVLGSVTDVAITMALLIAASLGVGFFISSVSRTETQAVQFSLLVLLASVFFSGFFLPLENLLEPVWAVSYALPVTYGIQALQRLMLRGETPPVWIPLALAGIAVGLFILASLIFQRLFTRR